MVSIEKVTISFQDAMVEKEERDLKIVILYDYMPENILFFIKYYQKIIHMIIV